MFEIESCYAVHEGLKLSAMLMPWPSKFWEYRHAHRPHLNYFSQNLDSGQRYSDSILTVYININKHEQIVKINTKIYYSEAYFIVTVSLYKGSRQWNIYAFIRVAHLRRMK